MPASVQNSGQYVYTLNGAATDIEESWQRKQLSPWECKISSRRQAPGVAISVDAYLVDGLINKFQVLWQDEGSQIQSDYRLMPDSIRIERSAGGGAVQRVDIPITADDLPPLLFPLMRVFTGPLIARLIDAGGKGEVLLPFIGDPGAKKKLLSPQRSQRSARVLEANATLVSAQRERVCRRCEYSGDQYGPESEFWLDHDDLLLRYRWQQSPGQLWDVWLQRDSER